MTKLAIAATALVLTASPAMAAGGPGGHGASPGADDHAPQGKAYGFYCKDQSRKHVAGTPGTPFSACVKAMARLANGSEDSPRAACADLSRKHVKGEKGTPFSRCVVAAARLQADEPVEAPEEPEAPAPSEA